MIPLAQHLPEFQPRPAVGNILPVLGQADPAMEELVAAAAEAEQAIAAAFERGLAEARAETETILTQSLDAQRLEFDRRLAEERQAWTAQQGERLAELLTAAMAALEGLVTGSVERALQPFLETAVRQRAVRELAVSLDEILGAGNSPSVRVSGPEDLLDELAARLGAHGNRLELVPAAGCDVTVTAGETRIETRIGAWLRGLAGVAP